MHEYVESMRKHVGKDPLLLVAAGAIIHKGRKILLQRRADNGSFVGTTHHMTIDGFFNANIGRVLFITKMLVW